MNLGKKIDYFEGRKIDHKKSDVRVALKPAETEKPKRKKDRGSLPSSPMEV